MFWRTASYVLAQAALAPRPRFVIDYKLMNDQSRTKIAVTTGCNVKATRDRCTGLLRYMAEHGGGHIAVISSIAGTKGLGPAPAYSATKALQNTYIEALEQLANARKLNIRFTDLRPGFVDTDLLNDGNKDPLLLKKEKVARDIVRSIEKHRHVRVIDGRWRVITFAWRLIPKWLWRHFKL